MSRALSRRTRYPTQNAVRLTTCSPSDQAVHRGTQTRTAFWRASGNIIRDAMRLAAADQLGQVDSGWRRVGDRGCSHRRAEVIDTWGMTATPLVEPVVGRVAPRPPAKPYHALVLRRMIAYHARARPFSRDHPPRWCGDLPIARSARGEHMLR